MEDVLQHASRVSCIFDLSGWQVGHVLYVPRIQGLIRVLQTHYPERLLAAMVVRSPAIFSSAWRLIKVALDPSTAAKVHFLPVTPAAAERVALTERLPESLIPLTYGGKHPAAVPTPNFPGLVDAAKAMEELRGP